MAWHTETDLQHEIRATLAVAAHTALVLVVGGLQGGLALHPALVESFWIACLLLWGHSLRVTLMLVLAVTQIVVVTESGLYFYLIPAATLALAGVLITGKIQKEHVSLPLTFSVGWIALTELVGWFYAVTNARTAVPDYTVMDMAVLIAASYAATALLRHLTLPQQRGIA